MVPYVPHAPSRADGSRCRHRRGLRPDRRAHLPAAARTRSRRADSTPTMASSRIWNVAWVADALIVNPRNLYDANIFYPNRATPRLSPRPTSAPALLAVPAWGLTGNPYLAHNTVVVVAFVAGRGRRLLPRALSVGQPRGGCRRRRAVRLLPVHLRAHSAHPVADDGRASLLDARLPPPRRSVVGGARAWCSASCSSPRRLSCAYYGIFAGLMVGLGTLFFAVTRGLWRSPRYWARHRLAAVRIGGLDDAVLPALPAGAGPGLRAHARRRADV